MSALFKTYGSLEHLSYGVIKETGIELFYLP